MIKNSKVDYTSGKYFTETYLIDYDRYSAKEFLIQKKWFTGWQRLVNKHLPLAQFKTKKILEVGCSVGAFISVLFERFNLKVDGVEMNEQILKVARTFNRQSDFFVWDIEAGSAPTVYDLIFSFEVLEHVENPRLALENLFDSIRPGGFLVFSSAYPFPKHMADPYHISLKTTAEWQELAAAVGFKTVYAKAVSFLPLLFRWSGLLSRALPWKTKNKYFVTTNFLILQK